jgi:hypothetical protein
LLELLASGVPQFPLIFGYVQLEVASVMEGIDKL